MLQEIVIKLELDSTSSTGVRLCLGEISSEELHRVCREAAQVHSSVCTAVGQSGHGSASWLGWAGAGHLLLLHFIAGAERALWGGTCCCVWASQGSAQRFLWEAAHWLAGVCCSLP